MVIAVAIGDYEQNPESPEFEGAVTDLDGILIDIENSVDLFANQLNYDIFPNYARESSDIWKQYWTQDEIMELLQEKAMDLDNNLNDENAKHYDALILIISCHGIDNHIITSDWKKISKEAIHRLFSAKRPKSRKIPRIFIFDCCAGHNDRDYVYRDEESSSDSDSDVAKGIKPEQNIGKGIETGDIHGDVSLVWAINEDNPDARLVVVNAANHGFQSKMDTQKGSYVITKLTKKIGSNINGKNELFLMDILNDIQEELHDKEKKQLMEKKFNNKTEYIKFVKNLDDVNLEINNQETKPQLSGMNTISGNYESVIDGDEELEMVELEAGFSTAL